MPSFNLNQGRPWALLTEEGVAQRLRVLPWVQRAELYPQAAVFRATRP